MPSEKVGFSKEFYETDFKVGNFFKNIRITTNMIQYRSIIAIFIGGYKKNYIYSKGRLIAIILRKLNDGVSL